MFVKYLFIILSGILDIKNVDKKGIYKDVIFFG